MSVSADYFVWETVLIEHPVACYTHTNAALRQLTGLEDSAYFQSLKPQDLSRLVYRDNLRPNGLSLIPGHEVSSVEFVCSSLWSLWYCSRVVCHSDSVCIHIIPCY